MPVVAVDEDRGGGSRVDPVGVEVRKAGLRGGVGDRGGPHGARAHEGGLIGVAPQQTAHESRAERVAGTDGVDDGRGDSGGGCRELAVAVQARSPRRRASRTAVPPHPCTSLGVFGLVDDHHVALLEHAGRKRPAGAALTARKLAARAAAVTTASDTSSCSSTALSGSMPRCVASISAFAPRAHDDRVLTGRIDDDQRRSRGGRRGLHRGGVDAVRRELRADPAAVEIVADRTDQAYGGAEASGGDRLIGALAARAALEHAVGDGLARGGCATHARGEVDVDRADDGEGGGGHSRVLSESVRQREHGCRNDPTVSARADATGRVMSESAGGGNTHRRHPRAPRRRIPADTIATTVPTATPMTVSITRSRSSISGEAGEASEIMSSASGVMKSIAMP